MLYLNVFLNKKNVTRFSIFSMFIGNEISVMLLGGYCSFPRIIYELRDI